MAHSSYSFIDILLSSILALIMLGVGLSLTSSNFKNLVLFPRPLIIGLISQIIVLPIIAFTVSYFSNMSLPFKVGLIILACCPGGTTSGILTYFFKGNVALSITFTSINSIITLFTIPLLVNLSLLFYCSQSTIIHLSYLETIIQIFSVTIIPAAIGVLIRTFKPGFAQKAQRPIKFLLIVALAIIFTIYFFAGRGSGGTGITLKEIYNILPYALLLNVLCMAWGFYIGTISKLGTRNSYTIGIEASVHNTTLAFLVAGTLLHNQDMIKPSLIYAMFSFWTAIIYSIIVKKINKTDVFSDFQT
ncbi:MAG: bile acid:sodium symporter family protein [Bacteroidia bacterium]|nr:bile acid:sodium symporter family protein [Bacteroidia bacterium]